MPLFALSDSVRATGWDCCFPAAQPRRPALSVRLKKESPSGEAAAGRLAPSPGCQRTRYLTIVIVRNMPSWKCSRPSWAFIAQKIT